MLRCPRVVAAVPEAVRDAARAAALAGAAGQAAADRVRAQAAAVGPAVADRGAGVAGPVQAVRVAESREPVWLPIPIRAARCRPSPPTRAAKSIRPLRFSKVWAPTAALAPHAICRAMAGASRPPTC